MKPRRVWMKGANITNRAVPRRACGGALAVHALHSVVKSTALCHGFACPVTAIVRTFPLVCIRARSRTFKLPFPGARREEENESSFSSEQAAARASV